MTVTTSLFRPLPQNKHPKIALGLRENYRDTWSEGTSLTKLLDLASLNSELLRLTKLTSIDAGELDQALPAITEALSNALSVERASIWFYNVKRTSIVCADLFERSKMHHSNGLQLDAKDFPNYFNYLSEERTLPANNAHTDPATKEFSEVYLKPVKN